jgi:hypothetical protein
VYIFDNAENIHDNVKNKIHAQKNPSGSAYIYDYPPGKTRLEGWDS